MRREILATLLSTILWAGCSGTEQRAVEDKGLATSRDKVEMTDAEWRKILTPEEYEVLRRKGTERPFTGKYWNTKEIGTYACAGCGMPLFRSDAKYESGCGWPSFFEPIGDDRIIEIEDRSHGMVRTEIMCARCKGHLGHVFPDGPEPTGLRYCLNSVSLKLDADDED